MNVITYIIRKVDAWFDNPRAMKQYIIGLTVLVLLLAASVLL